jgi:DNA gyrase subunit A
MEVLESGETLLTVTENGYGKRSSIEEYRTQTRGGQGVFSIKTSKRNGKMVSLLLVDDHDELMMVTDKGKLIRTSIEGINVISRNTQGVRLINLAPKETLIGIARLPEGEESGGEETEGEENEHDEEEHDGEGIDPEEFPDDETDSDEEDPGDD